MLILSSEILDIIGMGQVFLPHKCDVFTSFLQYLCPRCLVPLKKAKKS